MSFELATNIKVVNPSSNIDELYGPYDNLLEAYATIPIPLRKEGKTFGLIASGEVVEYWWKSEDKLGDGEEVVKNSALGDKEDKFDKNSAFNKDFGKTEGTVAEGNDSRFHIHPNKDILDDITEDKVDNWDEAYSHSQSAHAPSDAQKNVKTDWSAESGDAELLNKPTRLTDFENDLEPENIKTDLSLYFDTETRELRGNLSSFTQKFIWQSGVQEFSLIESPVDIEYIHVMGQILLDELEQWRVDTEQKTVTILDELQEGDIINIRYTYIITQ